MFGEVGVDDVVVVFLCNMFILLILKLCVWLVMYNSCLLVRFVVLELLFEFLNLLFFIILKFEVVVLLSCFDCDLLGMLELLVVFVVVLYFMVLCLSLLCGLVVKLKLLLLMVLKLEKRLLILLFGFWNRYWFKFFSVCLFCVCGELLYFCMNV